MSIFKIADLNFQVTHALLTGHGSEKEGLYWSLDIRAEHPAGLIDGEVWKPRAYSDYFLPICQKRYTAWTGVLDKTFKWGFETDPELTRLIASLEVFENFFTYDNTLTFGKLVGLNQFELDWQALCDVGFNDQYDDELDLHIHTMVTFTGVEVPFEEEARSRRLLGKYITSGNFAFVPGNELFPSVLRPC